MCMRMRGVVAPQSTICGLQARLSAHGVHAAPGFCSACWKRFWDDKKAPKGQQCRLVRVRLVALHSRCTIVSVMKPVLLFMG